MKFDFCFLLLFSLWLFLMSKASKLHKSDTKLESSSRSMIILNKKVFNEAKTILNRSTEKVTADNFAKLFSFKSTGTSTSYSNLKSTSGKMEELDLSSPCVVEENNCPNIIAGWLKFLELTDALPDVPNTFVKNKQFFIQQSQNQSLNSTVKDHLGYINIPTEDYFYFELNKLQLKIYTSRSPRYRQLEKVLNINELIGETSLNPCKGGVEDVGNFAEGYCFMLKFSRANRFFVWELCSDNSREKDNWMTTLAKLNELSKSNQGNHFLSNNSNNNQFQQQSRQQSYFQPPQSNQILQIQSSSTHYNQIPSVGSTMTGIVEVSGTVGSAAFPGAVVLPPPMVPQYIAGGNPQGPITSSTVLTNNGNLITIATHHGPGWVPVGGWGPCSEPCGPGVQVRQLKCVIDDGCFGDDKEEKLCKLKECKKDLEDHLEKLKKVAECGQWHLLGEWTACSKPCGGGFQIRKRECKPANLPCIGKAEITQPCNMQPCRQEDLPDCKQIEGQLNMILEMGKGLVPVHLIININEVTISREPLLAPLASIPLSHISNLHVQRSNPGCFSLGNSNQQNYSLCSEQRELSNIFH